MILKTELVHGQWYYGIAEHTCVAQWDSFLNWFVYGCTNSRARGAGILVEKWSPPIKASLMHASDSPAAAKSFYPIHCIAGPTGEWTPEQCIHLSNNTATLMGSDTAGEPK